MKKENTKRLRIYYIFWRWYMTFEKKAKNNHFTCLIRDKEKEKTERKNYASFSPIEPIIISFILSAKRKQLIKFTLIFGGANIVPNIFH